MLVDKLFENKKANTILAPMAGYTDVAFRRICHDFGVGLTVTEMVSSKALVMKNALTKTLLVQKDGDKPCFCQIFGHEPQVMAESVTFDEVQRFDGIDINMGCPVRKIVGNGDGSALMENPRLAAECISAVRKVWHKPLSVKFRLGVTDDTPAVNFASVCRDAGADFVTVHFRTRKQMYAGEADYSLLPQIVKSAQIPVFANGDVKTRNQYLQLIDMGAYGVAVGRGAVGNPQVFAKIADIPYKIDILQTIIRQTELLKEVYSDTVVANEMKKHVTFYLKGKRNAKPVVVAVNTSKRTSDILRLVEDFFVAEPQYRFEQSGDKC